MHSQSLNSLRTNLNLSEKAVSFAAVCILSNMKSASATDQSLSRLTGVTAVQMNDYSHSVF